MNQMLITVPDVVTELLIIEIIGVYIIVIRIISMLVNEFTPEIFRIVESPVACRFSHRFVDQQLGKSDPFGKDFRFEFDEDGDSHVIRQQWIVQFAKVGDPAVQVVHIVEVGTRQDHALVFYHAVKEREAGCPGVLRMEGDAV